jgi:ribosomal-protein-alanine N-acetyltransferase
MATEQSVFPPILRPLVARDIGRAIEIEEAAYAFPWTRGIFEDCLRVGYDCRGIQVGALLVAYSVLTQMAGESHLLNLCVDPQWQRRRLGSILLEHCIKTAVDGNCESMFLEVRPSNRAGIGLYRKRGFQVVGERPDYYRAKRGREKAFIMFIDLDQDHANGLRPVPRHDPL